MRCTLPLLLSALCLAACGKPANPDAANTPANSPAAAKPPAPLERAYVVTCAPTGDARDLQWFESGKDQPFPGEALNAHVETLAKAGGNWNAAKTCSENRIALRIDARAPISEFWRFMDAIAAAGVYKFAIAMLQEFDPPFSNAGGGEPVWELDTRYLPLQLPVDGAAPRESKEPEFSLGLNLSWRKQFSRCLLSTNFQRETTPITEVEEVFSALLPAVAENKRFARSEQGPYSFATKLIEEALAKAAKHVKGKLTLVQLGEGGEAAKHRDQPGEHAPVAFMFLAIDAVNRFNASRVAEKLPPVEIQFALGAGRGQFLSKLPEVPKPVEKTKPKVEPWGDPPGELFEPKSAFTVTIEKLEKPAADGARFGYFFGGKAEAQTLKQLEEEVRRFAAWRSVKEGHPGWDSKKGQSRNVLAIRSDVEAPYLLTDSAILAGIEAGVLRFAIAARSEFPAEDYAQQTGGDGAKERPVLNRITGQYLRYDWDKAPKVHWKDQVSLLATRSKAKESLQNQFICRVGKLELVDRSVFSLREVCPELATDDASRNNVEITKASLIDLIVKHVEARIESGAPAAKCFYCGTDDEFTEFYFVLLGLEAGRVINANRAAAGKPALIVQVPQPFPLPPEPEMKPEEEVEYPKDEPPEEDPKDK